MKIIVREIKKEDIDNILEIENACFSLPWSRKSFEEELDNQMALYLCVDIDGEAVGYVGAWKIIDECHITNVAVHPDFRGLGFAKLLLKRLFEVCSENNIIAITLEVRESNDAAIGLYKGLEFECSGKRPRYYTKPEEDALIMWRKINDKI